MGRPRTTNDKRKAKGYHRPSRHGVDPVAPGSPLQKPGELSDAVSAEWDRLIALMGNRVCADDAIQFRELAEWGAELAKITECLAVVTPLGEGYGKLLYARSAASREFQKIAQRFGLDPAGRKNLPAPVSDKPAAPKVQTRPKTKLDKAGGPQ